MSTMTLEPCPFCGTDDHENSPWPSGKEWVCNCGNPDCAVEVTAETPEAAIAKWNRRAHLAQPAQAVDVVAIREVIADMDCDMDMPVTADAWRYKLARALTGEKAGPVADTDAQVSVPIKLPLLKVPEIKDWLADELQIYDCPARAVWAGLLAIVTGISVDEQIAMIAPTSPAPDKEG